MPAPPRPGDVVIDVLIVEDDFMVATVHSAVVARLDGVEVVRTVTTGWSVSPVAGWRRR